MKTSFFLCAQMTMLILPNTQALYINRLKPEESAELKAIRRPVDSSFGPFKNKSDHDVGALKAPELTQLPGEFLASSWANSSLTFPVDREGFVHCGHTETITGTTPGGTKFEEGANSKRDFHCALKAYMHLQAKTARDFAIPTGTIERRDALVNPVEHDLRVSNLRMQRERYLPDAPHN